MNNNGPAGVTGVGVNPVTRAVPGRKYEPPPEVRGVRVGEMSLWGISKDELLWRNIHWKTNRI